jgi:hypothetical protein
MTRPGHQTKGKETRPPNQGEGDQARDGAMHTNTRGKDTKTSGENKIENKRGKEDAVRAGVTCSGREDAVRAGVTCSGIAAAKDASAHLHRQQRTLSRVTNFGIRAQGFRFWGVGFGP